MPGWAPVRQHLAAGRTIIGIDEVGRGAWAGPVVAGAVILKANSRLAGVNDSKLVSAKSRDQLDVVIRAKALAYGLGWVEPAEVDARGLSWAIAESGRRALADLGVNESEAVSERAVIAGSKIRRSRCKTKQSQMRQDGHALLAMTDNPFIVLDGTWNYLRDTHDSVAIIKADSSVLPVASASIIAKVARDKYMTDLATTYPAYGFEHHVGYGTPRHRAALAEFGPTPLHRLSYKPVQSYVNH